MERTAVPGRLKWRQGEVVAIRQETAGAKSLSLAVPLWPGHRAGQHVDVRLTADDGYQVERSYSIASPPEEQHVTLTVERIADGEVSPYLTDELHIGDHLELRGPIGGYFVWEASPSGTATGAANGSLLLVAGGSGIVPLMAMLRHRVAAGSHIPTRLLYSSRTLEDVIYREELDRLAAADSDMEVVHTLTRAQPPGWAGYSRRIDAEILRDVAWPVERSPQVFVCGPTSLVEFVASGLQGLQYPAERIKTERFGQTGGV